RFTGEGDTRVVVSHESVTQRRLMEDSLRESEARFRSLTNLSSDWYWEQDKNFRFIAISGTASVRAMPRDNFSVGKTRQEVHALMPSEYYINMNEADWSRHQAILDAHEPFRDQVFQQRGADGQIQYISISGQPFHDQNGAFMGYRGVGRDLTTEKRAEHELRLARERMSFLLSATPAVIFAREAAAPYAPTFISDNLLSQFGYEPAEFLRDADARLKKIHPDDLMRVLADLPKVLEAGRLSHEYRFLQDNGHYVWVREEMRRIRGSGGAHDEIVGYMIDIADKKRFEEQLLRVAHYDTLTELPNRLLFYDRLKQALAQAERNQWNTGVLFIDLDRFKVVNDTLGHGIGDELLRQVSMRLKETVRPGDTVGRLGGDEFAVVLSTLNRPEDARLVTQKIMQAFEQPFELNGREMFVTASIGITVSPVDGQDPDTLIKNADTAMYRAKDEGRNNIQFYTPEMNSRALERLELENSLRRALERKEFLLYYQPKVSTRTGKVVGLEALLRWERPGHGLVSPADFIPILEDTGLIVPVGEWVLRTACAQIEVSKASGFSPVPIAVNLSARQLQSGGLLEMVRRTLDDSGVDPALIELEITESSLMHNTEEAVILLNELKKTGLRISIDDFGTGYSSLAYLKRFPVDTLKIDRSFVRDVNVNEDDAAIARAIVTMAHQLSLKVVAEGVETRGQLAFLVENGCDEAQGFLFSRPVPAEKLQSLPEAYPVTD
ncbi:MAG: EAL domain-containing protein, partial [Betaproteobacteria bacterium]